MPTELLAAYIDALIPGAIGIYLIVIGFEVFGKKEIQDPAEQAKEDKKLKIFRICGPILIVVSLIYLVTKVWIRS